MKKHNLIALCISMLLLVFSTGVLAATEAQTFNVDLPAFAGEYTSDVYYKSYNTNQKYYNNQVIHNGDIKNIKVQLRSNTNNTTWSEIGSNSAVIWYDSNFKGTGYYHIKLKNSAWTLSSYFSSGIWYRSY